MTEAQDNPPLDLDAKFALLDGKLEAISNLVQAVTGIVQRISAEQDQLRALILRKTESLQDTMDSFRETTRSVRNTADFAITHSVGNSSQIREEVEKLLAITLGVQRQQQILTSQVEELRRGAAEREGGGAPRTG